MTQEQDTVTDPVCGMTVTVTTDTPHVEVDGEEFDLTVERPDLDKNYDHTVDVVVDRVKASEDARSRITDSVETALEEGIRFFDNAYKYHRGGSEEALGKFLTPKYRDSVFIMSKADTRDPEIDARKQLETSLRRMKTDYVDLLLIHWPNPAFDLEKTLEALNSLREHGKIRELGVSNFPPSWLKRALGHAPVFCNQVEYHPFLSQQEVLAMAQQLGEKSCRIIAVDSAQAMLERCREIVAAAAPAVQAVAPSAASKR